MNNETPLLIQAMSGLKVARPPIWFMRQAGRYLPEYNQIRSGLSFLELTKNTDLAFKVTVQPYERFSVDGLIMFADILTPLEGAGVPLYFEEKRGPVLEKTISTDSEMSLLDSYDAQRDTPFVKELLNRLTAYAATSYNENLGTRPAVLGFAGAPFTMASYLIEGGTTKKFEKTKAMMFGNPRLFHKILKRITEMTIDYLTMQMKAGADAVQIFDSWGGILAAHHYTEFSGQYTQTIITALQKVSSEISPSQKKPVILFTGNASHLLKEMNDQKPDVISLDWRVKPEIAINTISPEIALQGNMDPLVLYGSPEAVKTEATQILNAFKERKGYVFNLGHGIHPGTAMTCVETMVKTVQNFKNN
jgi:uroporphyrinogen decarboxylase